MLNIRMLRESPDLIRKDLEKRKDTAKIALIDEALAIDRKHRSLIQESEQLRHQRNALTKEIARLKKEGKDAAKELAKAKKIPPRIAEIEEEQDVLRKDIRRILMSLPNILHESVPYGDGEEGNQVIRKVGKVTEKSFPLMSHVDLMERHDLADLERAAKIAGARFYYLKDELVLLEQALIRFALDELYDKGFSLIQPPFMMRRQPYEGVTDLNDFEEVMYKIEGEDLYLIATSEHPMAAMYMDELLFPEQLPMRLAGISPCFRKEAGSHGKDTKGIFRVHQFSKVEQFVFCRPEDSWNMQEELLRNAEELFRKLGLPYQVVNICTGDIGSVAAKKYDIEVWMPVQKKYREVVSVSNCTDYQANRLNIRFRSKEGNRTVHTLNGTAIATTRVMVAILENFQQKDGSVGIPKALHPYMHGITVIGKNGKKQEKA
ncbi:MAG: serine--tRNA ligase [DPANN group archaeon]|nr:serine--tRNA ligase [DPANN group archaeon]